MSQRTFIVGGNWKANGTKESVDVLLASFATADVPKDVGERGVARGAGGAGRERAHSLSPIAPLRFSRRRGPQLASLSRNVVAAPA